MPKVSRVNTFRKTIGRRRTTPIATAITANADKAPKEGARVDDDEKEEQQKLSRGQRKRLAKREQYLKREKMVLSSLRLQKIESDKGRLDGLTEMRDALTQAVKTSRKKKQQQQQKVVVITKNNEKKSVAQRELPHLNLVLEHPSFQENPFATMQEHLKNTLANQKVILEQQAQKERLVQQTKQKQRTEARKEHIRDAKYLKCTRRGQQRRKQQH